MLKLDELVLNFENPSLKLSILLSTRCACSWSWLSLFSAVQQTLRIVMLLTRRHSSSCTWYLHLHFLFFGRLTECSLFQLFRHGDRTPVRPYPNDPYKDVDSWPVSWGQLTNVSNKAHNRGIDLLISVVHCRKAKRGISSSGSSTGSGTAASCPRPTFPRRCTSDPLTSTGHS